MARFLVQTRRSGQWALARLEQAIDRRRSPPDDLAARIEAVHADDRVCLLIDVPPDAPDATGAVEHVFEQVWYDAFGDSGVGHLTVPLW